MILNKASTIFHKCPSPSCPRELISETYSKIRGLGALSRQHHTYTSPQLGHDGQKYVCYAGGTTNTSILFPLTNHRRTFVENRSPNRTLEVNTIMSKRSGFDRTEEAILQYRVTAKLWACTHLYDASTPRQDPVHIPTLNGTRKRDCHHPCLHNANKKGPDRWPLQCHKCFTKATNISGSWRLYASYSRNRSPKRHIACSFLE